MVVVIWLAIWLVGYPTNDIRLTGSHTTHNGGGEDREICCTAVVRVPPESDGGEEYSRLGSWYPIQYFED